MSRPDPDLLAALEAIGRGFGLDAQVLVVYPNQPTPPPAAVAPEATQPSLPDLDLSPTPPTRRHSL